MIITRSAGSAILLAIITLVPAGAFAQATTGTGGFGSPGATAPGTALPPLPGATGVGTTGVGTTGVGTTGTTVPNTTGDPVTNNLQDSINASATSTNANNQAGAISGTVPSITTSPGASTAAPSTSSVSGVGATGAGGADAAPVATQSAAIQTFGEVSDFTELLAAVAAAGKGVMPSFADVHDVKVVRARSFANFYPEALSGMLTYNKDGLATLRGALKQNSAVTAALDKAGADSGDVIAVGGNADNALVLFTY